MLKSHKRVGTLLLGIFGIASAYLLSLKAFAGDNLALKDDKAILPVIQQTILLPIASLPKPGVEQKIPVVVTAYSSSIIETDDTPFITASGAYVQDGIVANNMLPFGTRVKLPQLFPDKIFVVKDRMNQRKPNDQVDIWFPSRGEALEFGAKLTVMEVLE